MYVKNRVENQIINIRKAPYFYDKKDQIFDPIMVPKCKNR